MVAWFEKRNGRPRKPRAKNNSSQKPLQTKLSSGSLTPPPTPPPTLPAPPPEPFYTKSSSLKKKSWSYVCQHLLSLTERMLDTIHQLDREISAPRKRKRPREGDDVEREGPAPKKHRE